MKIRSIKFFRDALHFATPFRETERGMYVQFLSRELFFSRSVKSDVSLSLSCDLPSRKTRRKERKKTRFYHTRLNIRISDAALGSDEIHLSSSHVRVGKILDARRTHSVRGARARSLGQSKIETGRWGEGTHRDGAFAPPARLSNQSATNEQHELACKTTRPARAMS